MPGSCCPTDDNDPCASACANSSNVNCCGCNGSSCPSEDEVAGFLAKYEQDE